MFNVSEIIHNQIPDAEGNIIPASVHEGSAEISGTQGENEHVLIAMAAGTYNVQKATCGTYCTTCQGAIDSWVLANPFAVAKGGTNQLTFTVQYHSGTQYNRTSLSTWSSSNTGVATVNTGLVSGVSTGTATMTANDDSEPDYYYGCSGLILDCPQSTGTIGSAPGGVGPYQVEPININSQGPVAAGSCPTNQYAGYVKYVTNQVQYSTGAAFAFSGLSVADTITTGSRHDLGSGTSTGSATTTGDGSFQDQYSVCSSACPGSSGETDASQNWTVNGVALPHVNGVIYKCVSISIDGH